MGTKELVAYFNLGALNHCCKSQSHLNRSSMWLLSFIAIDLLPNIQDGKLPSVIHPPKFCFMNLYEDSITCSLRINLLESYCTCIFIW